MQKLNKEVLSRPLYSSARYTWNCQKQHFFKGGLSLPNTPHLPLYMPGRTRGGVSTRGTTTKDIFWEAKSGKWGLLI